jgi:signal transduction histidine kinase/ribosomal protein L23
MNYYQNLNIDFLVYLLLIKSQIISFTIVVPQSIRGLEIEWERHIIMTEKSLHLEESKELFAELFQHMNSAVFIVDKNVRVQAINESFRRLFKKDEADVLNTLCGNAIGCVFPVTQDKDCGTTPECKDCNLRKSLIRCMEEKSAPINTIIERKFLIGSQFVFKHFLITVKYFKFQEQDFGLVIALDVTDIEAQRKRLEDLLDERNRFLGTAAYNMRDLVSAITLSSSIILKHYKKISDDERTKMLNSIQNTSESLSSLLNEFIQIPEIDSYKFNIALKSHDYLEFISSCLERLRLVAREKQIELEMDVGEDIPPLQFDQDKISQVVQSLMNTAIEFSAENSTISIKIETIPNFVVTKLIAEGPGIPADEIALIFSEFRARQEVPLCAEKNRVLDLVLAKKIITRHSGEIGIRKEDGGRTLLYFSLPISVTLCSDRITN